MKINSKYIIGIALAILTACTKYIYVYSVGDADNAIVLSAGISEGGSGVQTKAAEDNHDETENYGGHKVFSDNTQLRLRVDGTWLGHGESPYLVSQTTTGTVGSKTGPENLHNTIIFETSEKLYWDDYGTADPANIDTPKGTATTSTGGRGIGLTIYGAAVNGVETAPDVSSWTEMSWNVGEASSTTPKVINQTSGWSAKDLLTSNNITSTTADGTYKFDERGSGKLLEFTHAMAKITVNLTANDGFTVPAGGTAKTFKEKVSVTLLSFYHTGNVSVEAKTSTKTESVANIQAHLDNGGVGSNTATFDALVFPGNQFPNDTKILEINADDNIYYVNATLINAANTEVNNTFEQGKNYIFNITVNKTGIDVTATIKDWEDVTAENEAPKIVIDKTYGGNGSAPSQDMAFSFFRSLNKNNSYGDMASVRYTHSGTSYKMTPQLYWPDHSTHYFFRGVWPVTGTTASGATGLPALAVTTANSKDVVAVANVAYTAGTYPSDLMLAMPRNSDGNPDETCKVDDHKTGDTYPEGICATTGKISMDFRYMMSQVIVKLTTSTGTDQVTIDGNTTVELTGGYKEGSILMGTGAADFTGKSTADYGMTKTASYNTSGDGYHAFHDAIIPQSLVNGESPTLKFRITVKQGESYDKYETILGIKDIPVNGDQRITSWEPGKKYIYNLKVTKSDIKVEARITDWTTTEGGTTIWM